MSSVVITPKKLCGTVRVPPSKSTAHRAVICAAMAKGESTLSPVALSDDIRATIGAVRAMGAEAVLKEDTLHVNGSGLFSPSSAKIDCGESGSTLRFLIPVAAAGGLRAVFMGHGRLPERPIGIYLNCLPEHGVRCETKGGLPLAVKGKLEPGTYTVPGNVSSQFITGLLLALPLLSGDSEIALSSPLESAGYVDMTTDTMRRFGVIIESSKNGWRVPGNQVYKPQSCAVEGDWSQAAFFLAAGALGGSLYIDGLDFASVQGDKAAEDLYKAFGAQVTREQNTLTVYADTLRSIDIDASQIPDLVPILAATAALAKGTTHITGAARLRIKESDRLQAIGDGLNRLGARVQVLEDGLLIDGVDSLSGGRVEGYNDHRIVMALAVAASRASGPVEITDAHSINKSYPAFFEDYNALGGDARVIGMG